MVVAHRTRRAASDTIRGPNPSDRGAGPRAQEGPTRMSGATTHALRPACDPATELDGRFRAAIRSIASPHGSGR